MDLSNENTKNLEEKKSIPKKLSRRFFLKTSLGMGVGVAGAALLGNQLTGVPGVDRIAEAADIVQHNDMPVEISADYKRYDQCKNVIMRSYAGDPVTAPLFARYFGQHTGEFPSKEGPGRGRLEDALMAGAGSIEGDINGYHSPGFASQGLLYKWDYPVNPDVYKFDSPELASKAVKKAAEFCGASLVGIAPYDERWVFETVFDMKTMKGVPNVLPFKPTNVVVMALEMSYEGFQGAPDFLEMASTANIYSNMSVTAHKVSAFIRRLGYHAIACGNDTALSVPLAVQAGLGELSRIGILLTPEFGPRVRICKVFTDLPLAIDKPITFGAMEFCKNCRKCADACPSGAISKEKEPSFDVSTVSTNGGVKKWAMDCEKCLSQWAEVGTDCGICIKVCPYNKSDEWHHDLVRLGTRTPARPVLRFFDDLFGYGKISVEDATKDFWNK
ncbi:MAG: reductive dehalogenase [Dehalobacter sp. 4CP]|uniref:reductive dehalogenase n=1 Tax=Dehalobacter sp. CP TaxID=2594474 RepID=UPI0013C56BAA|nr:reductive dehalogenase [Dehalobacter sp.]NBJ15925.1 reductive dehalogenase [Dehalobacter sp. 4CP]